MQQKQQLHFIHSIQKALVGDSLQNVVCTACFQSNDWTGQHMNQ